MKKILIDFFDEENLNNCMSQLLYNYDEIFYLYYESQKNMIDFDSYIDALVKYNEEKLKRVVNIICVNDETIEGTVNAIKEIFTRGGENSEDEFTFNLTGGPELFICTVGVILSRYRDFRLKTTTFDIESKSFSILYPSYEQKAFKLKNTLDISDSIALQAAAVKNKSGKIGKPNQPNIYKNDYSGNVYKIWDCVKDYLTEWNVFCQLVNETKKTQFSRDKSFENKIIKVFNGNYSGKNYETMLKKLDKKGIIKLLLLTDKHVEYTISLPYEQQMLLDKGGNIFEMYAYCNAFETRAFTECSVGVDLDWDGVIDGSTEEVTNEVDLILSNGYALIFISCKNTEIKKEYLYEIETIAHSYGGKFAKPVIMSTKKTPPAIAKRAQASGIILIDNISNLGRDAFKKEISQLK